MGFKFYRCFLIIFAVVLSIMLNTVTAESKSNLPAAPYNNYAVTQIAYSIDKYGLPAMVIGENTPKSKVIDDYIAYYENIFSEAGYDFKASIEKYVRDVKEAPESFKLSPLFDYSVAQRGFIVNILPLYEGKSEENALRRHFSQNVVNYIKANKPKEEPDYSCLPPGQREKGLNFQRTVIEGVPTNLELRVYKDGSKLISISKINSNKYSSNYLLGHSEKNTLFFECSWDYDDPTLKTTHIFIDSNNIPTVKEISRKNEVMCIKNTKEILKKDFIVNFGLNRESKALEFILTYYSGNKVVYRSWTEIHGNSIPAQHVRHQEKILVYKNGGQRVLDKVSILLNNLGNKGHRITPPSYPNPNVHPIKTNNSVWENVIENTLNRFIP